MDSDGFMMTLRQKNAIEIHDMTFYRDDRVIFDSVNIVMPAGKITAIMGPSGCGKTTLLRLIGGQIYPESGKIWVNGQNIPDLNHKQLFQVRRQMGMLFQSGALFTDMNVFENVAFPLREHTHLNESFIRDVVLMKLEAVGLRGAEHLMPSQLSGGMQRRVALARSIALDPNIIMFDEPFAGQDPIGMGVLVKLIQLLNSALDMTTVIVSHDVAETASIADYIYVIAQGRVIGQGTPKDLREKGSDWVKQFLEGLPDGPVPFHYPAPPYAAELFEGDPC